MLLVGFLLVVPADAQVASYDCGQTQTVTENAVCTSPELSRKDVILATCYDILLHLKPATSGMAYREFDDMLRDQQRQFQISRDACGANTNCLEQHYDDRLTALRQTVDRYAAVVFDRPSSN